MQVSFDVIEKALVEEKITIQQFIEILIDNFGMKKTQEILQHNLKLSMDLEE